MLRKKLVKTIAVCTAATVLMSSCGGKGKENVSKQSEHATEKKENLTEKSKETPKETLASEEGYETKILAKNSNHGNMVSTDEGMYRISNTELPDGSRAYMIYYVDYASAQEVVLCSDTSCEHDSTDCMGIIQDDALTDPYLFIYKDKLYVFSTQDDSGSTMTVMNDAPEGFRLVSQGACLYQMNLEFDVYKEGWNTISSYFTYTDNGQ